MKRTYFPGITDIVVVTDPAEIRTISNDSRFDRDFIGHGPVRNVQSLRKMLRIFSLNGRLFPTILPRTNPSRAAAQDALWSRLSVKAAEVKHGPAELELEPFGSVVSIAANASAVIEIVTIRPLL